MNYAKRVAQNVLPLSTARDLKTAIREWHFTGRTVDHEIAEEQCQMCEQENVRYHFEILNEKTARRLMVGSKCILRFDVPVIESGRELGQNEKKKHLNMHMSRMRSESCMRALNRLVESENNEILSGALEYFKKHEKLSPKFAYVVFWRLNKNKIDHDPSFFPVSLKREQHQTDFRNMPTDRVHLIWPALSVAQRRMAIDFGHTEPKKMERSDSDPLAAIKQRLADSRRRKAESENGGIE